MTNSFRDNLIRQLKKAHYPPNINYSNPSVILFLNDLNIKGFLDLISFRDVLEKFDLPYQDYPINSNLNLWNFETRLVLDNVVLVQWGIKEDTDFLGKKRTTKCLGYVLNKRWYKKHMNRGS